MIFDAMLLSLDINDPDCSIDTAAPDVFRVYHNIPSAPISSQSCGLNIWGWNVSPWAKWINNWINSWVFPLVWWKAGFSLRLTVKVWAAGSRVFCFCWHFKTVPGDQSTHCQWRRREQPGSGGSGGPWSHQSVLQQTEKAQRECDIMQAIDTAL